MELLHVYADGSKLYKMYASALTRIPIWKGNRIVDPRHVKNIKESTKPYLLDSGYKLIQYKESEDDKPKSFIIDGQHRISVVTEYLETKTFEDDILPTKDFQLTVTEIRVGSEADAISYFNKINNVKPIQFEEDPNLIINTYIVGLEKQFPGKLRIKRPYLSADKLREALRPRINSLKKLSVDDFVTKCKIENGKMLEGLKRDNKMAERMIQLHFALAWDFKWLDGVLSAI